jgi:hypothetical protein
MQSFIVTRGAHIIRETWMINNDTTHPQSIKPYHQLPNIYSNPKGKAKIILCNELSNIDMTFLKWGVINSANEGKT